LIELAAPKFRTGALGREAPNRLLDNPAADFGRCIRRAVSDLGATIANGAGPFVPSRPFDRSVGIAEVRCTDRDRLRVQPVDLPKSTADTHAFESVVLVAGIVDRAESAGPADVCKLAPPPTEQRTKQPNVATWHACCSAHSCKPANAGAACQTHHERLRLIVDMVRRKDGVQAPRLRPTAKEAVTLLACALLDRTLGLLGPLDGENFVRNSQLPANRRDSRRLVAATLP
jgi:hypothetical protein